MKCKSYVKSVITNEKGEALIEATMIFPMVILAIISVVIMIVFIANMVYFGVNADEFLLKKTGELSKTTENISYKRKYEYKQGSENLTPTCYLNQNTEIQGGGLLNSRLKGNIFQRRYKLREKNYILYKDLFNGYFKE